MNYVDLFINDPVIDNEEEDFDDHFPGNAGIGAFDDDIPMKEPEVDEAKNDPSDDLGQALHNVQVAFCPGCQTRDKKTPLLSRLGVPGWETGTTEVSQPGQISVSVVVDPSPQCTLSPSGRVRTQRIY